MNDLSDIEMPESQYIAPENVLVEIAEAGAKRANTLRWDQILILSVMAGGFITVGALFGTLIATGVDNEGITRLLEGFGFSVGSSSLFLSGALLFTEVNVELPATLLSRRNRPPSLPSLRAASLKLWFLAAIGNIAGAFVLANVIVCTSDYGVGVEELLGEIMATKMRYQEVGGVEGFSR